jgi:hypothetical protein
MQVDTRDGIFAGSGYGGGVFNQRVAMGAVGRINETLPSGIGAVGLGASPVIPWYCWDSDGFKGCHGECWRDARDACVASNHAGYASAEACIEAKTLQCATSYCVPIYCAAASAEKYPWKAYSGHTANLQGHINEGLEQVGYHPIQVDGKLGPATCGAANAVYDFLGSELPETCYEHQGEWVAPTPIEQEPPPVPIQPPPVMAPPSPVPEPIPVVAPKQTSKAWMWIGGLGLAAAAAGVYAMQKKKK